LAVRRRLIERKIAFVERICFCDLRRVPYAARHGQIGVAARLGKNLHLGIDAAEATTSRIGESKISMNKGVASVLGSWFSSETAMAKHQLIAEFGEHTAGVLDAIGTRKSVMQMDLNFSPAGVAMLRQHLNQGLIVLLGGIKIGMDKRAAIVVTPAVDHFRILARPIFQAALLLGVRDALMTIGGVDGRLEVIGQSQNDVHRATDRRLQRAPNRRRHNLSYVGNFVFETHFHSEIALTLFPRAGMRKPVT
jgi:hypothetical protein